MNNISVNTKSSMKANMKAHKIRISDLLIVLFMIIMICICLFPFINLIAVSMSSDNAIIRREVYLLPVDFTLKSYEFVLADKTIIRSLFFTIFLTILSTVVSMLATILCAYPLSQDNLKGKRIFNTIAIFTMYFAAGDIPNYINIKNLGLLDNIWSLVLPGCLSIYNMIILKSFFKSLPVSLSESAQLDGATHFQVLTRIILPLSLPALATLSLFYAVGRWNGFQDAMYYIKDTAKYTMQQKLYYLISNQMSVDTQLENIHNIGVATESLKAAVIMFATVPILIIYPWLQRYFISGTTLGAIKE